jgi:hypothetical protein
MSLGAAFDAGRALGRLEEANRALREEIRRTALVVGSAFCDALARDMALDFAEPPLPARPGELPFLDDVQIGDPICLWYRVRGSALLVAYIHGMWRNEIRVYRDGVRLPEWDSLQRELAGEPVSLALRRIPGMIRSLG